VEADYMDIAALLLISIALSLDACGIALCIGLNGKLSIKERAGFILSFGFFQFLLALIGALLGTVFTTYVASIPNIAGGIVIAIVGILMVNDGRKNEGKCILLKKGIYFILGISVSIDAMVIGFTALSNLKNYNTLISYTLIIGLVTVIDSTIAFITARYLKRIELLSKYSDYIGGIILILFGLKMIFL
jgi:manganese efflux pump family protein